MIFKSTHEVLDCPWEKKESLTPSKIPPKWDCDESITFNDVVIWEQIYHQPGNLGIYVAWSPMDEFYIVVYDLFTNIPEGIKVFKGDNAVQDIISLANKIGIELSVGRVKI